MEGSGYCHFLNLISFMDVLVPLSPITIYITYLSREKPMA